MALFAKLLKLSYQQASCQQVYNDVDNPIAE